MSIFRWFSPKNAVISSYGRTEKLTIQNIHLLLLAYKEEIMTPTTNPSLYQQQQWFTLVHDGVTLQFYNSNISQQIKWNSGFLFFQLLHVQDQADPVEAAPSTPKLISNFTQEGLQCKVERRKLYISQVVCTEDFILFF